MGSKIRVFTGTRWLSTGMMLLALVVTLAVASSGCEFGEPELPAKKENVLFGVVDEENPTCEPNARITWVISQAIPDELNEPVTAGFVPEATTPNVNLEGNTLGCVYSTTAELPEHPFSPETWNARAFDEDSWVADCPPVFVFADLIDPTTTIHRITFRRFETGCVRDVALTLSGEGASR